MSTQASKPFQEMLSAELARNDDWLSVLAHFEYHTGFAFALLLLPNEALLPACRAELEQFLRSSGRGMVDLSVPSPDQFVDVCLSLRDREVAEDVGAVWISAVISEHDSAYAAWRTAFQTAFARLNPLRNALQQRLKTTLIFVCAPWTQSVIRNMAPDLWSVRSVVTAIQVSPPSSGVRLLRTSSSVEFNPESAPDPLFALSEAEHLRGVAGQELPLARLLFRAGLGLIERQQFDDAISALRECLELRERFSGSVAEIADTHTALARAMTAFGKTEEAISHFRSALNLLDRETDWKMFSQNLVDLSEVYRSVGRPEEAVSLLTEAMILLEGKDDRLATLNVLERLGVVYWALGNFAAARTHEQAVVDGRTHLLGSDNLLTLGAMNNLAITLREQGDLSGARSLAEQVFHGFSVQLGEESPETLRAMQNLATTAAEQGDLVQARMLREKVSKAYISQFGEEHASSLSALADLAATISSMGDYSTARSLETKVLRGLEKSLGEDNPQTIRVMANLAVTMGFDDDLAGARKLIEEALIRSAKTWGERNVETLKLKSILAGIMNRQQDFVSARELYEQVLHEQQELLGDPHPSTLSTKHDVAVALAWEGNLNKARRYAEAAAEGKEAIFGAAHPETVLSKKLVETIDQKLRGPEVVDKAGQASKTVIR